LLRHKRGEYLFYEAVIAVTTFEIIKETEAPEEAKKIALRFEDFRIATIMGAVRGWRRRFLNGPWRVRVGLGC
jgi:hypothetical protein